MALPANHSTRSLANNYEMVQLEATHLREIPNSAKLYKCFEKFDEVIPTLGLYKRVMTLIRDQLYDAVFSQQYTVDAEPQNLASTNTVDKEITSLVKKASIERVPYFEILNKIVDERNSRAEIAEEQVKQLNSVVEELNDEIAALKRNTSEVEFVLEKQREEINDLQTSLVEKDQENNRLDIELRYQQEKMERRAKDYKNSLGNLKEQLVIENSKVNELSTYKKCHDDVQDEFRDPSVFSPAPKKGLFSAKEQKLRKDIAEGTTIEKQLLLLRNTCIDEYDQYLEENHFREKKCSASSDGGQTSKGEGRETAFANMISNIENELAQNVLHLSILKNELNKISEVKREPTKVSSEKLLLHAEGGQSMHKESELLEHIKDASMNYKFVPQEPSLSKYALLALYSCNQGKTFQELPSIQHCKSCAANTLVCPHKATTGERIFHLPLQCTHIKFTRPELQVPHSSASVSAGNISNIPADTKSQRAYPRLWSDLALRESTSQKRAPRILQKEFFISLIEQFYASVVLDDVDSGEDKHLSILETWYVFLKDRYRSQSVADLVAGDVLETIQCNLPLQPFVQMFAECLGGNVDPAAFRYFLILRRLLEIVHWTSLESFSAFSNIVYPFMDVDDLEQFTMSYRAFSQNRIDESMIRDFFLSLILKQREPAFHDMANQLLSRAEISSGVMTDITFFESMADISPLSSERLCQRLYAQSQADMEGKDVSITRLSQIASYLVLHEQSAAMEMEIKTKLQIE